jgi:hypothetical protein
MKVEIYIQMLHMQTVVITEAVKYLIQLVILAHVGIIQHLVMI